jgi:pyruvate kinase
VFDVAVVRSLVAEVSALRERLLAAEIGRAEEIAAVHPMHRRSASNLVHYVELRNHDVRELQTALGMLGVSSLGRSEPYVLATVEAVLTALSGLAGLPPAAATAAVGLDQGLAMLDRNAELLLGAAPAQRSTRIMVTLPSEAADDEMLVTELIGRGMDIARINCAHDDNAAWKQMVAFLRAGISADGRKRRIAMDLGGPKLRTGPLLPGPRVVRVRPRRDRHGRVVAPALVWLTVLGHDFPTDDLGLSVVVIPVDDAAWLGRRRAGDVVGLTDSRGARRRWAVVEVRATGCLAEVEETTYVMTGLQLSCRDDEPQGDTAVVGELNEIEQAHRVRRGDRVVLTRSLEPALPTPAGADHRIGCSLSQAFERARVGERVWLDDGKIGGAIESVADDEIVLTVTDVRPGGANLKAGKGINLPDTDLRLDALTAKDLEDLDFVAGHADMVNLSFVRRPADVRQLQAELRSRDASDVGIVLKIENLAAFESLPELLLAAMRSRMVGVMIARGDLAVEMGFERLAEVQEEIMWACEAAHVPVIWATQVLDTMARTGQPSRAEVTDAAMSERAECVMLNKGPYIGEAITALDSILTRMNDHQDKKRSLLRRLGAWDHSLPTQFI